MVLKHIAEKKSVHTHFPVKLCGAYKEIPLLSVFHSQKLQTKVAFSNTITLILPIKLLSKENKSI